MKPMIAVALLFVSLVLISCHRNYGVRRDTPVSTSHESESKSTLVFFIHGDGSYTYHDQKGKRFEADKVILQQAIAVAENSAHAEVFIFHQKPKRKWLFLIDRPEGSFYYFRNGVQLARGSYHRRTQFSGLDSEIEIFKAYRYPGTQESVSGFLYFGHSLAELNLKNSPSMNLHGLAQGLSCLVSEVDPNLMKFDLVVLSACYSGTPRIVTELAPFSRYILASAEDLHLAYLDIQPLRRFSEVGFFEVHRFAKEMASQSFARLKEWTQTSIALTVYDSEKLAPFLQELQSRHPTALARETSNSPPSVPVKYCDCWDTPSAAAEIPSAGVEVYYQPPRFGRLKYKTKHSGWACLEVTSNKPK